MADLAKTVSIIFAGDDRVSPEIQGIESRLGGLGRSVDAAVGPLANLTTAVLAADAAILALVGATFNKAVQEAGKFSGSFAEISTLISDTGQPIEDFRKQILDYSLDSVKSIDQINQAIYNAVSAGVDYKDSVEFVGQAEKLAVAGKAELNDTTKALASTLNAYGASMGEAERYSDIMFTTVRMGQTTMSELSASLAQVLGVAVAAEIPFETLSAAIAALTVSGMPTSQAITGLKAAISNIIKPSAEARDMAASLGFQFDASALSASGLDGVLRDIYQATGGNVDQMSKLFGSVEGLNAVTVLAADRSGKFKEALQAMGAAAGATETAYKKMADEFENVNQRLKNAVTTAFISIGTELMPAYGEVAKGITELFKSLNISIDDGAFEPVLKAFRDMGVDIGKIVQEFAKNLPEAFNRVDWSDLIRALAEVTDGIKALFGLDNSDPERMAQSIQRVVDSMATLTDVTRGILEAFAPFGNAILRVIDGINNLDGANKALVGNLAGVAAAYKMFGPVVGTVFLLIGQDSEFMSRTVAVAFSAIENGANATALAVIGIAYALARASRGVVTMLDLVPGLDMSAEYNDISQSISFLEMLMESAFEKTVRSSERVKDAFNGVNRSSDAATETGKRYADALKGVENQTDAAKGALDGLTNTLANVPENKQITLTTKADTKSIDEAWGLVTQRLPDGSTLITNIGLKTDKDNLAETKKQVDEVAPETKETEIRVRLEETRIKEQSATIQKALEWKAKLDIAQVEADAEKIKAIFQTIGEQWQASAGVSTSLANAISQNSGSSQSWDLLRLMERETRMREALLTDQKDLMKAQTAESKARAEALKRGDAIIKINGEGLAPEIEAFMWKILETIQIRANADGFNALVNP